MQLHALVAAYQALPLTLMPLSQTDARSLLARRLGAARTAAEPEAVDRIIRLAGQLPLALANVAARAAYRPQLRLASLADEYEAPEHSTLDAFESDEDQTLDVRESITRSYRLLDTETAALFRDLSACPDPMFAASQVADLAGRPERRVRQVLSRLTRAHLVAEIGPGRYCWNRLVAAYAVEQAGQRFPDQGKPAHRWSEQGPASMPLSQASCADDATASSRDRAIAEGGHALPGGTVLRERTDQRI
jgi:hypothetical protein